MLFRYFLWETPSTFLCRLKKQSNINIIVQKLFSFVLVLNLYLGQNALAFRERPSLPRSILKDWCEGCLVRALLGYADANDADVDGRVVLEGVANHQSFLLRTTINDVIKSVRGSKIAWRHLMNTFWEMEFIMIYIMEITLTINTVVVILQYFSIPYKYTTWFHPNIG